MTEYSITVAFEIIRPKTRTLSGAFFQPKSYRISGSNTVSRLLGRRLESSTAFKNAYQHQFPEQIHDLLKAVNITNIRSTNSILTLTFEIPPEKLELADDLRRVNSRVIDSICLEFGLQLESRHYIYGVAASTSNSSLGLERNVRDCWMHDQSSARAMFISHQVAQELAARIAIERALIAKALDDPSNPLARWARAPLAARLIRTLPVELLIDRQDTQASYREMREAMNLQNLRDEVLERGRIWYVGVGTFLTFVAAVVGVVALYGGTR